MKAETVLLLNALAAARRVRQGGKDWIVADASSINPGVLNGSKGSLYYPSDECAKNARAWDGVPIVVYHPTTMNGEHISASDPRAAAQQIGVVRDTIFNGKLRHKLWIDAERVGKVDRRVLDSLNAGQPIELSTGLYTDNEKAPFGANHNGRPYDFIARNYKPDHIAILPDQQGACSIMDGCGVLVNQVLTTNSAYVVNPAVSEAQRRYLNATFGHDWVKDHDFDNKGPLPERVTENDGDGEADMPTGNASKSMAARFVEVVYNLIGGNTTNAGPNSQPRHPVDHTFQGLVRTAAQQGHATHKTDFPSEETDADPGRANATADGSKPAPGDGGDAVIAPLTPKPNNLAIDPTGHTSAPATANANPEGINQYSKGLHSQVHGYAKDLDSVGAFKDADDLRSRADSALAKNDSHGLEAMTREAVQTKAKHGLMPHQTGDSSWGSLSSRPKQSTESEEDYQRRQAQGRRSIGANANPNQGAAMFPEAHQASKQAAGLSVASENPAATQSATSALQASAAGKSKQASNLHNQAADAHQQAASDAFKANKPQDAATHLQAAGMHTQAAAMHSANCPSVAANANKPGTQSTPQQRNNDMAFNKSEWDQLIANCACPKTKAQLIANAPNFSGQSTDPKTKAAQDKKDGIQDADLDDSVDNDPESAKGTFTGNAAEWFAQVPPAYQDMMREGIKSTKQKKIGLVRRLVANVAGDKAAREAVANRLLKKSMGELEEMAQLLPPVHNADPLGMLNNSYGIGAQDLLPPVYAGAGVGYGEPVGNAGGSSTSAEALYTPPTINYAEAEGVSPGILAYVKNQKVA